tara:strand:- start:196 stop:1143 length:948 start_codon:yes stop_codon:yes gene_type:complete
MTLLIRYYFINILFIIFLFFAQNVLSQGTSAKIVIKINNQVITNQDILNEKKFLVAFNENLKNLDDVQLYEIAQDSLIKHYVKIHELKRHFILNQESEFLRGVLSDFYIKIGIENDSDINQFLINNNISEKEIKEKLEVEALWNELIYKRYINQVKIDEVKLKEKLKLFSNTNTVRSYLLSEILFNANTNDEVRKKYSEILESISMNGFENTANIFSSADSANFGGKIGWVNESKLSNQILNELKNYETGDFTKPITMPGGFLILRINDIRMEKLEIDTDKELEKLIVFERNKQLDQFSLIYYKKVEANAKIDEK